MKSKAREGQTFVEVVIVVTLVVVVVTALVAGTIASLKATNFTSLKSQATKYAQEGIELARRDRDQSWNTFFAKGDQTWCVDKNGTWVSSTPCQVNIDNTFTRSLIFVTSGNDMEVTAQVSWKDGSGVHQSQIQTYFTQWR